VVRGVVTIALALATACGRIGFDPLGGNANGDGGIGVDGATDRPNVVFVTTGLVNGAINGAFSGLHGADATCQSEAMDNGLPGTFVAFLSTSTVNARDRIAGSRGWIRTDGAPVADSALDFVIGGKMLNAIDHDANDIRVPFGSAVWTGTDVSGRADGNSCGDWTNTTAIGASGRFDAAAPQEAFALDSPCTALQHLYCFEIGHAVPVAPVVSQGRIAFLSSAGLNGVAAMDMNCQADATAAGLPGTYRAAVATTGTSVEARFVTTGAPWRRIDGTQVSATAAAMFDGSDLLSFVHQTAAGMYESGQFPPGIWSGATSATAVGTNASTCGSWTMNLGQPPIAGLPNETGPPQFWGGYPSTGIACSTGISFGVLCLQQ
jgi:hypothetical protein